MSLIPGLAFHDPSIRRLHGFARQAQLCRLADRSLGRTGCWTVGNAGEAIRTGGGVGQYCAALSLIPCRGRGAVGPHHRSRRRPPPVPRILDADRFLPGMAFCYQGEELGLSDSATPASELQDPLAVRNQAPELGRDRVRTPMPWQPGPGHGFTSAPRP